MKLAIADPPYLGRADRWYGDGRGTGGGLGKADHHPEAHLWDDPASHVALLERLVNEFDGWAIAAAADSLPLYLAAAPADVRVMIWHRRNAPPSGARVRNVWEPVIISIPRPRRGRTPLGHMVDVLDAPASRPSPGEHGFVGAKPAAWTRWVLAALGYEPAEDELTDVFRGSGAVAAAADGMLLGLS